MWCGATTRGNAAERARWSERRTGFGCPHGRSAWRSAAPLRVGGAGDDEPAMVVVGEVGDHVVVGLPAGAAGAAVWAGRRPLPRRFGAGTRGSQSGGSQPRCGAIGPPANSIPASSTVVIWCTSGLESVAHPCFSARACCTSCWSLARSLCRPKFVRVFSDRLAYHSTNHSCSMSRILLRVASWTLSWNTMISSERGFGSVEVAAALKSTRGMRVTVALVMLQYTTARRWCVVGRRGVKTSRAVCWVVLPSASDQCPLKGGTFPGSRRPHYRRDPGRFGTDRDVAAPVTKFRVPLAPSPGADRRRGRCGWLERTLGLLAPWGSVSLVGNAAGDVLR